MLKSPLLFLVGLYLHSVCHQDNTPVYEQNYLMDIQSYLLGKMYRSCYNIEMAHHIMDSHLSYSYSTKL